jgi:hypothetical protein
MSMMIMYRIILVALTFILITAESNASDDTHWQSLNFSRTTSDEIVMIYTQTRIAVVLLMRHYRQGAYRVIRDPEGIISLWVIEGSSNAPFSISFANKGRVYNKIEDVPDDLLKSFLEYVRNNVR